MNSPLENSRAFLLQNGLRARSSHFLQESGGWVLNLEEAGLTPVLHANVAFDGDTVAGRAVERSFHVVPDSSAEAPPLIRRLRTFLEGSAQFSRDCSALENAAPGPGDLIVIPYATDVEMMGLARWLTRRKAAGMELPFVTALIHRPDYDWQWNREESRLTGDLTTFAYGCHSLRQVCGAARLALMTTNQPLARVLEGAIGLPFVAGCAPIHHRPLPPRTAPRWDFVFLGQMRPEKGSRSLARIVAGYLEAQPQARIAIQCDSPREPGEYLHGYADIAHDPRIDWRMGAQNDAGFADMLEGTACVLLPVEPTRYQLRISGVFSEALGMGRPVVVSGPTWMTEMLGSGHGAGIGVANTTPEVFIRALLRIRERREEFLRRAGEQSLRWRQTQSLARLVALIRERMTVA